MTEINSSIQTRIQPLTEDSSARVLGREVEEGKIGNGDLPVIVCFLLVLALICAGMEFIDPIYRAGVLAFLALSYLTVTTSFLLGVLHTQFLLLKHGSTISPWKIFNDYESRVLVVHYWLRTVSPIFAAIGPMYCLLGTRATFICLIASASVLLKTLLLPDKTYLDLR
ncbi:hypothetical protein AAMO2058_000274500 [Amorphochlora amoebiformis]